MVTDTADQLPIEKILEAPVWCLPAGIGLFNGLQSICDTEKKLGSR